MSGVGQSERATQNRVIALFRDELRYRYLGDWTDRADNSNIEEGLLSDWLTSRGYSAAQISSALHKLRTEADNHSRTLYGNNQAVYNLLRYGVPVKIEAGMRHLIDTYIEADEPRKISPFDNMGLLDLIARTGIGEAIAWRLGDLKGNRDAIAETIENNVRRKILKEQLTDPAYYETMSALLDEIIIARKAKAIEYEEYLKRIAALARRVGAGVADDAPEPLKRSQALRALYNNLKKARERPPRTNRVSEEPAVYTVSGDPILDLAIELDGEIKRVRPDGWRGIQARENTIKAACCRC